MNKTAQCTIKAAQLRAQADKLEKVALLLDDSDDITGLDVGLGIRAGALGLGLGGIGGLSTLGVGGYGLHNFFKRHPDGSLKNLRDVIDAMSMGLGLRKIYS